MRRHSFLISATFTPLSPNPDKPENTNSKPQNPNKF